MSACENNVSVVGARPVLYHFAQEYVLFLTFLFWIGFNTKGNMLYISYFTNNSCSVSVSLFADRC